MSLWKELRLLRLATFARVLRTAAAASARLPASLLARLHVLLLIRSASARSNFIRIGFGIEDRGLKFPASVL